MLVAFLDRILLYSCHPFFSDPVLFSLDQTNTLSGSKPEGTDKEPENSMTRFQALCTSLAATIGTGNIAGVAAAIVAGGPGSLFWMWISAFFWNDDLLRRETAGTLLSPKKKMEATAAEP